MKFLCVKCDAPMKLVSTAPPDRGSLRIVYACPTCAHEIAMLTNPAETQVVSSLGVRIGPEGPPPGRPAEVSRCPFSEMIGEMANTAATEHGLPWTAPARKRLENIPEFVRPMARTGIEQFARDRGYHEIDEAVLDRAKDFFGM